MKKLLFSLVAAGACGGVIAAPGIATFENYGENAFSVELKDDGTAVGNDSGYWSINMTSDPELTLTAYESPAEGNAKYLQINTGSTPLWRTFGGVNASDAVAGTIPAGEPADGKIVSSKVKLTACTEWPDLTDFAAKDDDPGEKLALFLFKAEEGDTSNKEDGLYAVGGKQTDNGLQPEAYLLTGATVTAGDWVTVTIKTYGDINKTSGNDKLPGFVVAVNNTVLKRSVATGLSNDDLNPTVAARNTIGSEAVNGTLIPAIAYTTSANLQGLGFQGEGGIDDVNLAALEVSGMADAVAMTVAGNGAGKATFGNDLEPDQNGVITVPASVTSVSFTLNLAANEEATVTYMLGGNAVGNLTNNGNTYTFAPVANATLTITVRTLLFQANGTGYATFTEALTAALAEGADGTVMLLADLPLGTTVLNLTSGSVTIDLNGQTISGSGNENDGATVIMNSGANLVITDSSVSQLGNITANNGAYAIWNAAGTLTVNKGIFNGAILTDDTEEGAEGTATINGGKFSVKVEAATIPGDKKWSDLTEGYYTLVAAGPVTSTTVDLTDVGTGADVEVTPTIAESVTEVTVENVPQGFAGKVVIPSTVEKINLGIDLLKVMATVKVGETTQSFDIAGVLKIEDGKLVLDETKAKPALAEEDPFVVGDTTAVSVKTIPGLKYSLVYDSDLSFESVAKGETAAVPATTTSMTLTDDSESKPTKRFYKVKVTK